MDFKFAAAAIGIALVVIYAVGSGLWVNTSSGWYASLNRPSIQPPDLIFGIIWPYNFIVIGLCAVQIANNQNKAIVITWLALFATTVALALNWAYLFYVPHNLQIASISLALVAILTLPLTFLVFKTSLFYGALFTPYQLWVITAAILSNSYSKLN
ncbi:MAG: hypothetical protein RL193_57 [Actinomycetota bacterium]|jgi:tryptophan-rich sensory protein